MNGGENGAGEEDEWREMKNMLRCVISSIEVKYYYGGNATPQKLMEKRSFTRQMKSWSYEKEKCHSYFRVDSDTKERKKIVDSID